MGQYHYPVNLTKKQYLNPHTFGDGLKLREFGCSSGGTLTALTYLLASSNGRGGGDFADGSLAGKWAGDKIAIIGDYSDKNDIEGIDAAQMYAELRDSYYEDISVAVKRECRDCNRLAL
jgi:hypothetical protein